MATNYGTVEALAPSYDKADALTQAAYAELGSAAAGVVEQIGTAVDQTQSQATEEMLTTVPNDMGITGGEMAELMDGYNDVIAAVSGEMALLAQSTANQIQMMQANYENLLGGMREGLPYLEEHIDQQMAAVSRAGYSSVADAQEDLPEDPVNVVNPFEFPEGTDQHGYLTKTFALPGFIEQFGPPNPNSVYDVNMVLGDVVGLPMSIKDADGLNKQRTENWYTLQKLFGWPVRTNEDGSMSNAEGIENYALKDLVSISGQAYYRYFQFAITEGYDPDTAINIADTMLAGTELPPLPDRSDQTIKTILKWTTIQNSPAARNLMAQVPNIRTGSASFDPELISAMDQFGHITGTPKDPEFPTGDRDAGVEPGGGISPGHQGLAQRIPDDPTEVSDADAGMFSGASRQGGQVQKNIETWEQQKNDPIFNYQSFDADDMWRAREAEARNAAMLRDQQRKKAQQSRAHLMNPTDTEYYDALGAWAHSLGL